MTTLTRAQAKSALTAAGWPSNLLDTMVAIGAQESSLRVDVTGQQNSNGTVDYGWLQINSQYVTGTPHYDKALLLSDATYTAKAALDRYHSQGLKAWVAFTSGDYRKYMPPPIGPALAQGSKAWFLVVDLQTALNRWLADTGQPLLGDAPKYGVDGAFGPHTQSVLVAYQQAHPVEPGVVGAVYGRMLYLW